MQRYRIAVAGLPDNDGTHRLALAHHPRFDIVTADRAEAIVLATAPPADRAAEAIAALDAGLHVMIAPPVAFDAAAVARVAEAASRAHRICGVSYEFRFTPQSHATKELIVNRHLGPLRSIEIARQNGALRAVARHERDWTFDEHGGVALWGLSHSVDLANWYAGRPPLRVFGFARTANPARRDAAGEFRATADDGAFAVFDYGDGLVARLSEDRTAPVDSYLCAIYGEDRVAVTSGLDVDTTTLYTVDDDETNELQCKPSGHAKHAGVALLMELYDEFARAIDGEPNALPTIDEAVETQRAIDAIRA